VFRRFAPDGRIDGDLLSLATPTLPGTALLVPFMRAGRPLAPHPSLGAVHAHARTEVLTLPEPLRSLDDAECCPVEIAPALRALAAAIDART
jgi:nicotinate phosphoribosyltransferase